MSYRSGTDDRRQVIVPQRGQSREPRGYRLAERVARFVIVLSLSLSLSISISISIFPLPSPPLLVPLWLEKGKHGTRTTVD